ncbi:MAG: PfkB family carbohydrate kinase [bacterium]
MASLFKKIFNNKYDIVTIGDVAVDAFIEINQEQVGNQVRESINPITGHRELGLAFGEKIPYKYSEEIFAVGNSGNAAVASARLGLSTAIITTVGGDLNGQKAIEKLNKEHVETSFVTVNKESKTNYHYILWYKADRTILTKHEDCDYKLPEIINTKWIYLSSISDHSVGVHNELINYLEKYTDVKLIFQPGTFQLKMGRAALRQIYARTDLFFCNIEEAEKLLELEIIKTSLDTKERSQNIKRLLLGIQALGVSLPIITDGPNGAYVLQEQDLYRMPIFNDINPPLERTGAGDAFSATFSACHMRGMALEDCLKWASINSMSVCKYVGSHKGLLNEAQIKVYLDQAPKGWGLVKM